MPQVFKPTGRGKLSQCFVVAAENIASKANIYQEGLIGYLHHSTQTVMSVPVFSHEVNFEFHAALIEVEHAHALVTCVGSS